MSPKDKQQLEAQLREDTHYLLEHIWELSNNESFASLANRSGLSAQTLYRLWGGLWKRPQFLTMQKLALAVGLEIELSKNGLVMSIAQTN